MHVQGFTEDVMEGPCADRASSGWRFISNVHGLQPVIVQSQEQKAAPQDSETLSLVDELSAMSCCQIAAALQASLVSDSTTTYKFGN